MDVSDASYCVRTLRDHLNENISGVTQLWPSVLMFLFYGASFTSLNYALTSIKVGVAYAIWSGAGIILISFIGALFFEEKLTLSSLLWIAVILTGIIGLNISGKTH